MGEGESGLDVPSLGLKALGETLATLLVGEFPLCARPWQAETFLFLCFSFGKRFFWLFRAIQLICVKAAANTAIPKVCAQVAHACPTDPLAFLNKAAAARTSPRLPSEPCGEE
eukprot:scaffold14246_cov16-Tisochrysis_lutea.AAC.1